MAILTSCVVFWVSYISALAIIKGWARFWECSNRPFAPAYPDIDPPLWRVAFGHAWELFSTLFWLIQYPSFTEVWMALCLLPFLFIEFPLILNNIVEWGAYLLFGNSQGDGSHTTAATGAPPIRWGAPMGLPHVATVFRDVRAAVQVAFNSVTTWLCMMIGGAIPGLTNWNNALLCYLQKESWSGAMHHLDNDVLEAFPTSEPNSRANAVMMARCATMAYDRWHNIDQAVSKRWSRHEYKYSLVKAWSFDRLVPAHKVDLNPDAQQPGLGVVKPMVYVSDYTSVNTDAFLLKVEKPGVSVTLAGNDTGGVTVTISVIVVEVALVLAFRGTEALQTVDWISDLANVNPPDDALDRGRYPLGFTHQGFRDCLGLKRDLRPADHCIRGSVDFTADSSYLIYTPGPGPQWEIGDLERFPPQPDIWDDQDDHEYHNDPGAPDDGLRSPYAVITKGIEETLRSLPPVPVVKIFITGHSLGGALAHLYTGALLLNEPHADVGTHFEAAYTFGEPRVGSQEWVTLVEDALRQIPRNPNRPHDIKAEDRFKRVVNTLDIITRIPPPLGEVYQHPGHCTFINEDFIAAFIRDEAPGATSKKHSAVANLIETPDIFLWPTVVTVGLKLLLSVLLLFSRRTPSRRLVDRVIKCYTFVTGSIFRVWILPVAMFAAAVVFWVLVLGAGVMSLLIIGSGVVLVPIISGGLALAMTIPPLPVLINIVRALWRYISGVGGHPAFQKLHACFFANGQPPAPAQPPHQPPVLAANPMHMLARLVALLGPIVSVLVPVLMWDVGVLLVVLFPSPLWLLVPFLWPLVITELFLASLALFVGFFWPPFIFSGIVDHSMAEYYTACWLTTDADWNTAPRQVAHVAMAP